MGIEQKIKKIEDIGIKKYQKEILRESLEKICIKKPKDLLYSPMKSLKWFISWGFLRGRNDKLSETYCNCAFSVLEEYPESIEGVKKLAKDVDTFLVKYGEKVERIKSKKGKAYKVNQKDKKLLKSIFQDFLPNLKEYDCNIVEYALKKVKEAKVREAYKDIDNINEVGDKICGCFLRDVISLFSLENFLEKKDYVYLQPIDTWLRQIVTKLWSELVITKDLEIKKRIVEECLEYQVSPITFNQGAWYLGSHSLSILIESL